MSIDRVITTLLYFTNARKATKYVAPDYVIKASRLSKYDGRNKQESFVITIGRPNYAEREFIKLAKKAGVKFPIKKIQLKFWPQKKPR